MGGTHESLMVGIWREWEVVTDPERLLAPHRNVDEVFWGRLQRQIFFETAHFRKRPQPNKYFCLFRETHLRVCGALVIQKMMKVSRLGSQIIRPANSRRESASEKSELKSLFKERSGKLA